MTVFCDTDSKIHMSESINILGIAAFFHDSAATLIKDGEIIAAAQEERFTRKKGDERFPTNAIKFCLDEGGIAVSDLNFVVFYESPYVKFDRLLETFIAQAPQGWEPFSRAFPLWASQRLRITREIHRQLGPSFSGKVCYTDHHLSHAASAFFPSPFDSAAILTLDAVGEWSTSSIGVGEGRQIRLLRDMRFPHSIGMLYSAFTYYTGFKVNSGEYKLMGLAPYGEPKYTDVIREKVVKILDDGSLWMDMSYFNYCQGLTMTSDRFHALFGGPPRDPEEMITQKDMDLAASIQKVTEEIVMKAARHAHELTGKKELVLAGGVALNCVANGKLLREGPFENLWIQPAAGDAGGALGAALLVWHHHLERPRRARKGDSQKGSFLGPSFDKDRIRVYLDSAGAGYRYFGKEEALLDEVARLMSEGNVVGWFHGRMEFGPRALGGRSIIGDARSETMQQKMNLKIKYRESFRPFAPCVLREHAHEVFELKEHQESPYMLLVAPVRQAHRRVLTEEEQERMRAPDLRIRVSVPRSTIPAITHVDYSARIQTVDEERHGRFYRLMKRFHGLTGCPVIVNTSFNIRGEPIVCTPEHAYRCFMATDMDCLVMDDYVLVKPEQPPGLLPNIEEYPDEHPVGLTPNNASMVYLPRSASTPALMGFGIVVGFVGVGVLLAAQFCCIKGPYGVVAAAVWASLIGGITTFNPVLLETPYKLCNRAIAGLFIRPIRQWMLWVIFSMVVLANRPFATRLRSEFAKPAQTTWHPKIVAELIGGGGAKDVVVDESGAGSWLRVLFDWIRATRNWWVIAFVPFLLVLAFIDEGEIQSSVSADTYTLY